MIEPRGQQEDAAFPAAHLPIVCFKALCSLVLCSLVSRDWTAELFKPHHICLLNSDMLILFDRKELLFRHEGGATWNVHQGLES